MGERELCESWESEERKLCEWSETVGTECFESGEGERESGIRELVEKEWYESEESCGSGERENGKEIVEQEREILYIQNVARDFCLRRGRESKMRVW